MSWHRYSSTSTVAYLSYWPLPNIVRYSPTRTVIAYRYSNGLIAHWHKNSKIIYSRVIRIPFTAPEPARLTGSCANYSRNLHSIIPLYYSTRADGSQVPMARNGLRNVEHSANRPKETIASLELFRRRSLFRVQIQRCQRHPTT